MHDQKNPGPCGLARRESPGSPKEDEGQTLVREWVLGKVDKTLCSFKNSKTPEANRLSKEFYL